jgi:RNA polymerase sigma-70 factor (ECF subfamily)
MSAPEPESTILKLPLTGSASGTSGSSYLEGEVMGLFDQMRNPLLRYVASFGLSAQDGEDVVQEVFLSLFRHLECRKSRANLRGWLFRVAHNLALKHRDLNRRGLRNAGSTEEGVLIDPAPTPENRLLNSETDRRVLAAFRALPEQDQHCLSLRAEGLRYREIAEVLGIALGTVSLSLARSLARLVPATKW